MQCKRVTVTMKRKESVLDLVNYFESIAVVGCAVPTASAPCKSATPVVPPVPPRESSPLPATLKPVATSVPPQEFTIASYDQDYFFHNLEVVDDNYTFGEFIQLLTSCTKQQCPFSQIRILSKPIEGQKCYHYCIHLSNEPHVISCAEKNTK